MATNTEDWARLHYQHCHENILFSRSHAWQMTYWGFVLYAALAAIAKNMPVLRGPWAFGIGGMLLIVEAGYLYRLHLFAMRERRKISSILKESPDSNYGGYHGKGFPPNYTATWYQGHYLALQICFLGAAFLGAMFWIFQDAVAGVAGSQPQQRGFMSANFWAAFWPGVTATFVGAVLGVLAGLWLNRRALAHGQQQSQLNERRTVAHALEVLGKAIGENEPRLQRLASALAQGQALFDAGLDTSTWDAVQAGLTAELEDFELRQQIASHFSRLGAVVKQNDLYVSFFVSVNASMVGASNTRTALKGALEGAVSELVIEGQKLVDATSAARNRLVPPQAKSHDLIEAEPPSPGSATRG